MKKKKNNLKSTCCKAEITHSDPAPDFLGDNPKEMKIGTCFYICSNCGEPCNIMSNERKTWTRNPVTRIQGDKREKTQKKLTKKEIKEIRLNEDF